MHENDGLYTAGFVENQVETLSKDNLSKHIAGIKPFKPDTDWAVSAQSVLCGVVPTFRIPLVSEPVPVDQWADVLCRQVSGDIRVCVSNEEATYRAANIRRRYLDAAVRNFLLDSAGDKYYPLVYFDEVDSIN